MSSTPTSLPVSLPMLASKIHRVTVTQGDLHYEGSITIDQNLLDAAKWVPFQKIEIYNVTNGERFSTYVIEGERGSGVIKTNGAAAHKASAGDIVILCAYVDVAPENAATWEPTVVHVNEKNEITNTTHTQSEVDDRHLKTAASRPVSA